MLARRAERCGGLFMHHDRAAGQQRHHPPLGQHPKPQLGRATIVMDFRRVDVGNADMPAVDDDGVAVDGKGGEKQGEQDWH